MLEMIPLKYEYNAFEPYIDTETMQIHYEGHYKSYTDKANTYLLEADQNKSINELIATVRYSEFENDISFRNNYGGYINHTNFFSLLNPEAKKTALFYNIEHKLTDIALNVFGSGYAGIIWSKEYKELSIIQIANQNILSSQDILIAAIDVWEHAYYLKYKNDRKEYIKNLFNIIDWELIDEKLKELV